MNPVFNMTISNVQEYISLIEVLQNKYSFIDDGDNNRSPRQHDSKFIYRGQANTSHHLIPGIFRLEKCGENKYKNKYRNERDLLKEFIAEACVYKSDISTQNTLSWMEIAQHFKAPTRLLDFTENPLIGLYFACSGQESSDAFLWIINTEAYNRYIVDNDVFQNDNYSELIKIVDDELNNPKPDLHFKHEGYIQLPRIYKPDYHDDRMRSQESIFMLWAAQIVPLDELIRDAKYWISNDPAIINSKNGIIGHIRIMNTNRPTILKQLALLGINEKLIFPGLDGIGKYIREKYTNNRGIEFSGIQRHIIEDNNEQCSVTLRDMEQL